MVVVVVVYFPAQSETSSDECNYKESCFASQRKLQPGALIKILPKG